LSPSLGGVRKTLDFAKLRPAPADRSLHPQRMAWSSRSRRIRPGMRRRGPGTRSGTVAGLCARACTRARTGWNGNLRRRAPDGDPRGPPDRVVRERGRAAQAH